MKTHTSHEEDYLYQQRPSQCLGNFNVLNRSHNKLEDSLRLKGFLQFDRILGSKYEDHLNLHFIDT